MKHLTVLKDFQRDIEHNNQSIDVQRMTRTSMQRLRLVTLLFALGLLCTLFFDTASAAGSSSESFNISYLYPLGLALLVAALMWKFFIPIQLANLQVAFEIDDDLYEVHRVTRDLDDARDLLSEGSVGYGLGLYMMGMTGVLILIGEFICF